MGKTNLLDCTLRDGGYINNWNFGEETIRGFCKKIALTGIEFLEVGFLKGDSYDPDHSVFPDIASFENVITPKAPSMKYVGMIDMSDPIPLSRITPFDGKSIDGIRIIFKKNKMDQAYEYCKRIQELGYFTSVNFVSTDLYTDKEFVDGIERFNKLRPFALSIVDTFGLIKRKHFLRLIYLADHNMRPDIRLGYHAHNNLQQAFGNAEAMVEMNLHRDLIIDACVFGMGRGAGNLNLELFAEFMNENYDTRYQIEPMLEIMDEYLNDIYQSKFWGYSLPLYLSAVNSCHPNYAVYLGEKNTLTVKAFNELLQSISPADKAVFSKESAERYYREYQEQNMDDSKSVHQLSSELSGKKILILAPGYSLHTEFDKIRSIAEDPDTITIAANFVAKEFRPDYVFSSNMRRFVRMQGNTTAKCIVTSNMKDCLQQDYVVNFASYASKKPDIIDNSVLMLLRLLIAAQIPEVMIAGMDGYSSNPGSQYFNEQLEYDYTKEAELRNTLISEELRDIETRIKITFITPTTYCLSK